MGIDAAIGQIDLIGAKGEIERSWRIRSPRCSLGSAPECSVHLTGEGIAPLHATLVFGKKHTLLRAHASTRIANRNVREWLIDTPTEIRVGNCRLVIHPSIGVMATVVHAEKLIEQATRLCKQSSQPCLLDDVEPALGLANPNDPSLEISSSTKPPSKPFEPAELSQISDLIVQSEWETPFPIQEVGGPWIHEMPAFQSTDILAPVVDPAMLEPKANAMMPEKKSPAQSNINLESIEELLTALKASLDNMQAKLTEETQQSTKIIASSVNHEFDSFGRTWFASLNEKFDHQSVAQLTLLNQFSDRFADRFGAIDDQLNQMHESNSRHAETLVQLWEQAQSDKQRIDTQLKEVLAQRSELVDAFTALRTEIANAFSQGAPPSTSLANQGLSVSPSEQMPAVRISDEVLAESLELAQHKLHDFNQQVKELESERAYAEQRIQSLARELQTGEETNEFRFSPIDESVAQSTWYPSNSFVEEKTLSDTDASFGNSILDQQPAYMPAESPSQEHSAESNEQEFHSSNLAPLEDRSGDVFASPSQYQEDIRSVDFALAESASDHDSVTEFDPSHADQSLASPSQLPDWFLRDDPIADQNAATAQRVTFSGTDSEHDDAEQSLFNGPDLSRYSDDAPMAEQSVDQSELSDEPLGTDTDAISMRLQRMLEDADHRRGGNSPKPSEPISSRRWSQTYAAAEPQAMPEASLNEIANPQHDSVDSGSEAYDTASEAYDEYDPSLSVSFPIEASFQDEPSPDEDAPDEVGMQEFDRRETDSGHVPPRSSVSRELNSQAPATAPAMSAVSDSEEESIEEYMQRLLNRVRSGPTESNTTVPPQPITSKPLRKEPDSVESTSSDASEDASSEVGIARKSRPIQSDAFVPRKQAPEQRNELDALRELANSNARRAISRSQIRRTNSEFWFKLSITIVAILSATVLLMLNGLQINMPFAGMVSAVIVAILWGFDCIQQIRKMKQSGRTRITIEAVKEEKRQVREPVPAVESATEDRWRPSQA